MLIGLIQPSQAGISLQTTTVLLLVLGHMLGFTSPTFPHRSVGEVASCQHTNRLALSSEVVSVWTELLLARRFITHWH